MSQTVDELVVFIRCPASVHELFGHSSKWPRRACVVDHAWTCSQQTKTSMQSLSSAVSGISFRLQTSNWNSTRAGISSDVIKQMHTHTHHVYFSDLSTLSDFPASCPPDSPVEWFKKVRSSLLIPLIRVALKARDTEMTALEGFLQRAGLKCLTHAEHLKTWHSVKSEEQRWLASTPSVSANMSMCFVSFSLDSHALHNPDSPPKVVTLLHASGKSSEVWSFTAKQHCSILLNNRSRWGLCFKTQQNRFDLERLY